MFKSINPYSLQEIWQKDFDSDSTLNIKLNYAQSGYLCWKSKTFTERANCLLAIAKELRDFSSDWSKLISNEMGKTISEAKSEIEKCALTCDYYAHESENLINKYSSFLSQNPYQVTIEPKGAVFGIMPWNFPFWQVFRYVVPNLMIGNVCLLKHAPNVGMCANAIEEIFNKHTPNGVFQVLWADIYQIESIVKHPIVIGTTLTGSETAGKSLSSLSGKYLKKCVLELGGSDAFIVDKNCDLAHIVKMSILGRLQNNGQTCIASKRFLIHESIFEQYKTELKNQLENIKSGNPFSTQYNYGVIARSDLTTKLIEQINESVEQGAHLLKPIEITNNCLQPVVLVTNNHKNICMTDELFGPIFVLSSFSNVNNVIKIVNSSNFGLASSIWSNCTDFITILVSELEVGNVFVNELPKSDVLAPFGGTKNSGFGRELSYFGLTEFANIKTIKINYED